MVDPEVLLVKALIDVLDDLGIAPGSDEETVRDFIAELRQRGYAITKTPPTQADDAEDDDAT